MNNGSWLNYQHLYYFMKIAQEGGVSHAAKKLHITQSNLSTQLKLLEESLGVKLFQRVGRGLKLTASGETTLEYAEDIFRKGDELIHHFSDSATEMEKPIIVGALSPLSKNLQFEFIKPLILSKKRAVQVIEGELPDLLNRLKQRKMDLLLSNLPSRGLDSSTLDVHVLGEMPMYLVAGNALKCSSKKFPHWLNGLPLFLPTSRTSARVDFDATLVREGLEPMVQAEVDDTALLRLLALSGEGVALIPEIGIKFDLDSQSQLHIEKIPRLYERFYAITLKSRNPSPILLKLIQHAQKSLTLKS